MLFDALLKVFQDRNNRNFTDDLYRHPLIESAKPDDNKLPSYIEASTFSNALSDVFVREARKISINYVDGKSVVEDPEVDELKSYELLKQSVNSLKASEVKKLLQSFISTSTDLPSLKTQMENWYNGYMDRVTGWYKKRIKKELFWVSLCVAILLNADLFRIASSVWSDEVLRTTLVNQATEIVKDSTWLKECDYLKDEERITCLKKRSDTLYNNLKLTGLPIGWISELPSDRLEMLKNKFKPQMNFWNKIKFKIASYWELVAYNLDTYFSLSTVWGWILMAFALMQGAPFWFEVLTKMINIRGSGARPLQTPKK